MRIPGQGGLTLRWYVMMPFSYPRILHPDCLLPAIKLLHTAIWAALAGSILALPVAAFTRRFHWALILTAFIVSECGVLAANRGRCPLTT
jgi:ABC-type phosphate/phosphonate transport system permease subunit